MTYFVAFGPVMRPTSAFGWLVTVAALAFMVQVFVAIDAHSHSNTDTLYGVYPFWGVTFLLWDWLARRMTGGGR